MERTRARERAAYPSDLTDDWSVVPDSYTIGMDQLRETVIGVGDKRDPANLDVKVKVGWVKGQNHLYFLYEASDNYGDFAREDLHNDIVEVVIDGDLSGGPLIRQMHPSEKLLEKLDTHFLFHGVHARNYHIFTPAEGNDWAMVWGTQPWIKELPYANAANKYNFKPGESGKLVLEFFVTPLDYARLTARARFRRNWKRTKSSACPGLFSTMTTRRPSVTLDSGISRTRRRCMVTRRIWSHSA